MTVCYCGTEFEVTRKRSTWCSRSCFLNRVKAGQRLVINAAEGTATLLVGGVPVLLDEGDCSLVSERSWFLQASGHTRYAASNPTVAGLTAVSMHRLILGLEQGDDRKVDHKDGNGLNNRRTNLRVASTKTNRWNSAAVQGARSSYKGVNWHWWHSKTTGKWRAQISVDGRQRHLGLFDSEVDAARAYNRAASELQGEFARLNDVPRSADG